MEMNIEKFDPTTQELNKLVAKSQEIKEIDIDDKTQMATVTKARIELKNARVAITKKGKEMRDDALKFQRAVIEKEKELVAIIEPEEERLKSIEEEAKVKKERAERAEKLPWRKEKLAEVDAELSDDDLLDLDDKAFQILLNEKAAEKLARIEDERRAKEAEEARAKEIAEAGERAKAEAEAKAKQEAEEAERRHKEELERVEREAKEKEERLAREAKDKEEQAERERKAEEEKKAEAKRVAKEEEKRLAKQKDYKKWLADNGYSEETKEDFIAKDMGEEVRLYKLVGTYNKK